MALWGDEKKFDRNGDGKLSAGEWHDWYSATYGHDIELSERRREARAVAEWSKWLDSVAETTRNAAFTFMEAACELLPLPQREKEQLAWHALLCQISVAFKEGTRWLEGKVIANTGMYTTGKVGYPYRFWASDLAVKSGLISQKEFERELGKGHLLYEEDGALSAERCGRFWQQIVAQLPPRSHRWTAEVCGGCVDLPDAPALPDDWQHTLAELLESLFALTAFFAGVEGDAADERGTRLLKYFATYWVTARGEYVDYDSPAVRQLVEKFPELKGCLGEKTLADMSLSETLCKLYYAEPARAITVWRSLAGTTAPLKDERAAKTVLFYLEPIWLAGEDEPELLRPMLDALRDEDFARQMFQSAFVNGFQIELIDAAYACGEAALAEHFRALLDQNPYPWKRWAASSDEIRQTMSAWPKAEKAQDGRASAPDDGAVFHYCTVRLQGVRRSYAYLTGGLPLQVGDWVEVPFGKDDLPRRGQVKSITDCTRATAPWPPEQTKTVLRVVEAPVEPEKTPTQSARPAPTSKPKPAAKPAPEAQKVFAPEPPKPPEPETAKAPKRRFPWKTACVVLVFLAGVAAVAVSQWKVDQHYRQAQEYLAQSDFRAAAVELEQVPAAYQKQSTMARFANACLLAERGTLDAYETALNELSAVRLFSDDVMRAQVDSQYADIHKRHDDLVYETALECLRTRQFKQAQEYLRQVAGYPYASELHTYALVSAGANSARPSTHLQGSLKLLDGIAADYDGPFAEEIPALRERMAAVIADAQEREAGERKERDERLAALKAKGIPYVGMSEREVNSTRQLGKAAYQGEESEWVKNTNGEYYTKSTPVYAWYSRQNGDLVFRVECEGGKVVSAVKHGGDAYWNGDTLLVALGPQIIPSFNSGGASDERHDSSVRDDYDNPDDFYEDNKDWLDNEDEAWDYWYED